MPRPKSAKVIFFSPKVTYFKPRGVPLNQLKIIEITKEEAEALRLKNIEEMDQLECAKRMKTSQSTIQRILQVTYKKISLALIEGAAIKIEK